MSSLEIIENENAFAELIRIFLAVRKNLTDDSDFAWGPFHSIFDLHTAMDNILQGLGKKDNASLPEAYFLFLPTGALQEHAISNGWSEEYLKLSASFDRNYSPFLQKAQS